MVDKVKHIYEPTDLQCGQAVIAMLTGLSVEEIIKTVGTDRETDLRAMKSALDYYGIKFCDERKQVYDKSELPDVALLSLETPRCWHWSLYFHGVFFDPEHGELSDFPTSNRKYYWKIG